MFHYYVGLDLGQSSDYTAVSIIEEPVQIGPETDCSEFGVFLPEGVEEDEGWVSPARLSPQSARNAFAANYHHRRLVHPPLYLRHLMGGGPEDPQRPGAAPWGPRHDDRAGEGRPPRRSRERNKTVGGKARGCGSQAGATRRWRPRPL